MRKIEVKDEWDLQMEEIRNNNKILMDIQSGRYEGLSINKATQEWKRYKEENPDFDWSDEEREV